MKRILGISGMLACCAVGTAFSRTLATGSPPVLNGDWTVDLRTIGAVVVALASVLFPGTWWLSRQFSKIDSLSTRMDTMSVRMDDRDRRFDTLEGMISRLPCHDGECQNAEEHHHKKERKQHL